MRLILMLATTMAALFAAGPSLADDYDDCKLKCSADRDTRNANCPTAYDTSEKEREQCLSDSRDIYLSCVHTCPPPASSQGGPSTMTYEARHRPFPVADKPAPQKQPGTPQAS